MSYTKKPYLSKERYLQILFKIREIVNEPKFNPVFWKYVNSIGTNCGLCNKHLFDRNRMLTQYRQRCPFDMRKIMDLPASTNEGCFFHCYIFQLSEYETSGKFDITRMREMVGEKIRMATNLFFM
jgi:hypothetical protein